MPDDAVREEDFEQIEAKGIAGRGMFSDRMGVWLADLKRRCAVLMRDQSAIRIALLLILLIGAVYRFTGIDWGEQTHLHPDERFLTMVATGIEWPKSIKEYFDSANSPLNPYNKGFGLYVYGTYPVFLTKFVAGLVHKHAYDGIDIVGRHLSAILDLIGVVLVYLIGKRLYGTRQGLLAALLLAASVLNIQHSHFFVVDSFTAFAVTVTLYFAVRVAQGGGWGSLLGMGIGYGFAVAGKISMLTFGLILGLALLWRISREVVQKPIATNRALWSAQGLLGKLRISLRVESINGRSSSSVQRTLGLLRVGLMLLVVLAVAAFTFRVIQPYAFQGPSPLSFKLAQKYKENMDYISKLVSGVLDYPPSHQWTDRKPIIFAGRNMILWGMGLPLGITVWLGWMVAGYQLFWKRRLEHLLLWVWATLLFLYQSTQFVKTMRYFLPAYPAFILMGAYFLTWLWDGAKRLATKRSGVWSKCLPIGAALVIIFVVFGTLFYATAFTSIYTRPVTRVAASRWIYANIPRGTVIANETWDDPLPLRIDGKDGGIWYNGIMMDLYWEDVPEKYPKLIEWLDQAEYIFLSSNRLYGSIPRLPRRYPMTTKYYQLLLSEQLGFKLVKTFTSYPQLLGIVFNDDNAEEAFTVYDHPKVLIFKKTDAYSTEKVRKLLGGFDLVRIVRLTPLRTMKSKGGLMLTEAERLLQRREGTWSEIFRRDSIVNRIPTIIWLLVAELLGWAVFPLAFLVFRGLRDRGYAFARLLGLLLLSWLVWIAASMRFLPFTRETIFAAFGLLIITGGLLAWRQREALIAFLHRRRGFILFNEIMFLGFFLLFWLIRLGNPDLWHPAMGGEKPMDFAYLNAILRSQYFPPYDPWFAGGYINYYYYGLVVVATLIKMCGIVPWVAYNLAIPLLFALTATGVFSVVYNLLAGNGGEVTNEEQSIGSAWRDRAVRYGLLGALFVVVLGNLGELTLILKGLRDLSGVQLKSSIPGLEAAYKILVGLYAVLVKGQKLPFRPEWWYWNATRVMQAGEINEFPFFTFLYADLHAHLIALPFTVLALGLTVNLVKYWAHAASTDNSPGRNKVWAWLKRIDWIDLLQVFVLALALGELWVNNAWDYPTYLLLALLGLTVGFLARYGRFDWERIRSLVLRFGVIVILSNLLYWPFHAKYGAAYTSVELWKGERTHLNHYLIIHGMFLFILISYLLSEWLGRGARGRVARTIRLFVRRWYMWGRVSRLCRALVEPNLLYQCAWFGLVLMILLAGMLASKGLPIFALMVPVLLLCGLLLLRRDCTPEEQFLLIIIGLGIMLTLGVDLVVIKGDIGRMNTVFKFYLQVWVLWGVASAVALARLSSRWPRPITGGWRIWRSILVVLVVCTALYPLCATPAKIRDRFDRRVGPTLDGMRYMRVAQYADQNRTMNLKWDYEAIQWILDNIPGTPVILEANTPGYRWGSRISIYTGLPTVIGWDWHQKQQRAVSGGEVVDWRVEDVRTLYNTRDVDEARKLLERYHVDYIYVGELEQAYYDAGGLAKFDMMAEAGDLEVVYSHGPVKIYRVRGCEPAVSSEILLRNKVGCLAQTNVPVLRHSEAHSAEESHPLLEEGDSSLRCALRLDPSQVSSNWSFHYAQDKLRARSVQNDGLVEHKARFSSDEWRIRVIAEPNGNESLWHRVLGHLNLVVYAEGSEVTQGGGMNHDPGPTAPSEEGSLMLDVPVDELPVVDDRGWNRWANLHPATSILMWWFVIELLGLAAWPITARVFRTFVDRGYVLSKTLGLLLVGYVVWIGASLRVLANSPPVAYSVLACLGAGSFFLWSRRREEMAAIWRSTRGLILCEEILFAVAFLSFVGLRLLNPDLWQPWFGGEKMMEFAFLNAILKSAHFPPYDPYYAGGYINYYYYGQYLMALLIKLTGVIPSVGFNLAIPTLFAMTVGNVFSLGYNLGPASVGKFATIKAGSHKSRFVVGLAAAVFLAVIGNLSGFVQLVERFARVGGGRFSNTLPRLNDVLRFFPGLWAVLVRGQRLPAFDYWYRATRIIPYTINEFPFFSFLFADLHPHMINIAFSILLLALLLEMVLRETSLDQAMGRFGALECAIMSVSFGAVAIINTWELPTYAVLLLCVSCVVGFRWDKGRGLLWALVRYVLLVVAGLGLYWPFFSHYEAMTGGIGWVQARTELRLFLVIWGFLLFFLFSGLLAQLASSPTRSGTLRWLRGMFRWRHRLSRYNRLIRLLVRNARVPLLIWLGITLTLAILFMAALKLWVILLLSIGLGFTLVLLLRVRGEPRQRFVQILSLVALAVLLGCEVVYVRDFLDGGDWRRMNTVFKFYIQVWVLLSIAAAGFLPLVWHWLKRIHRRGWYRAWTGVAAFLLFAVLLYPFQAVPVRVNERFPGAVPPRNTLDGMAFMTVGVYNWPDENHPIELKYDYEAIQWLLENVKGTPVILEAALAYYREGGTRVAAFTGLPILVGAHEREQRPMDEVTQRERDVNTIYDSLDWDVTMGLLKKYRVSYIYVGQLERAVYQPQGLAKFEAMREAGLLRVAYHNEKVTIYQVT